MAAQPRLASTVMLLRDNDAGQGIEVFMVRRVVQSEFLPDIYVFPGGSVSADDYLAEETAGICTPVAPTAADPEGRTALGRGTRAAAIREMFEEANVLLAYQDGTMLAINEETEPRFAGYRRAFNERKGSLIEIAQAERLTLATDRLAYFAHWITPEAMPKRYDTHFFLALAPAEQEAIYDRLETSEGIWIRPAEALDRLSRKEFPTGFPTFHQLRDLTVFSSAQEAIAATTTRYVPTHRPAIKVQDGKPVAYLPDTPEEVWRP
jgi:8-oxo-dGTP pyrophosphatase MutT (NUDIX family)